MNKRSHMFPVILSGGSGTRLWPLSREALPKQLWALYGPQTMIQETALRVRLRGAAPPTIICNEGHRFLVAEQMQEVGITPRAIILEPVGRNTAAAAAVAALSVLEADPEGIVLLLPSDHVVADTDAFQRSLEVAITAAAAGQLVTFGIRPSRPETGYGYIRGGAPVPGAEGAFAVDQFLEKPKLEMAERFVADGRYSWNSGMFVCRADRLLEDMRQHASEVLEAATAALGGAVIDLDFVRLNPAAFAAAPSISLDHAVMERTKHAAVVPAAFGWSDVGAWSALWELGSQDAEGNVLQGDVIVHEVSNSFVRADGRLATLVGVDGLAVVVTKDAVLVADKARAQDVKLVVDRLKAEGRSEQKVHAKVFRPWGSYENIDAGDRFQVKEIMVKPGGCLSLQMHHHRAEHWIVVRGTARVTCGDKVFALHENESTFIPMGTIHRLENPGRIPLHIIEVQSGSYLGEDDIVRTEDSYGRVDIKT